MSVLAVDVGTSGVRAAVVRPDSSVVNVHHRQVLPSSPMQGFVDFDAAEIAKAVLEVSTAALESGEGVEAVGISTQRASVVVWDRATGEPVAPGIGWQDLRTVGFCLALQAQGIRLAPNQSATKLAVLLDIADADRSRDLCAGTVDSWVAWTLTRGGAHVSDRSNLAVTGLLDGNADEWDESVLEALRIPHSVLPCPVDSIGVVGDAIVLRGSPPIAGIVGDQQASLVGQGCVRPGLAKATFGTGAMLDLCVGAGRPAFPRRGPGGTFPIVAWSAGGVLTWGIEAIMMSAGSCVEWLRDDLGICRVSPSPTTWRRRAKTRAGSSPSRRCSVSERPSGTTACAAPCSASPVAPVVPKSCVLSSRGSPNAQPTSSKRPRQTQALPSRPSESTGA